MRLTKYELDAIKESFNLNFPSGTIYLFGSRTDDNQKGGDIDLYVKTNLDKKVERKISFLVELKDKIGEQKIDLVLSYDKNSLIEQEATKHGILIYETHNSQK